MFVVVDLTGVVKKDKSKNVDWRCQPEGGIAAFI